MLESLRKEINSTLSVLAKREAQIIKLFYGLEGQHPKTLEEIAEEFGLTRERVRQIRESAIRRLKQSNKYKKLKSYLV